MQSKSTERNVMIDVEALRLKQPWKAPLMQVAAVVFDGEGNIKDEQVWYCKADELTEPFEADPQTVMWWEKQDYWEELKAGMSINGKSAKKIIVELKHYLEFHKPTGVWFNHPTYDEILLNAYYEEFGVDKPWTHRMVRDMATLTAWIGRPQVTLPGDKHNALYDCRYQVMCLKYAHNMTGYPLK